MAVTASTLTLIIVPFGEILVRQHMMTRITLCVVVAVGISLTMAISKLFAGTRTIIPTR